jgi:nitrite reductase (NADH) small subunit
MGRWVRAARAADIPKGQGRAVQVDGRWIALFHDPERGFFATDDTCPHQGASLGEGTYHEGRVICPWHGWVFDVGTGACVRVPGISVACYATRPEGDGVLVELPDAGQAPA